MSARRGFTLLEVLVATAVMAIAVTTTLSALRTSLRNASRQVDLDRASALARAKMDELLLMRATPRIEPFGGTFDPAYTGGREAGWTARVTPHEIPAAVPVVGMPVFERVELEVWWRAEAGIQRMRLEGYRRSLLTEEEEAWAAANPGAWIGVAQ